MVKTVIGTNAFAENHPKKKAPKHPDRFPKLVVGGHLESGDAAAMGMKKRNIISLWVEERLLV